MVTNNINNGMKAGMEDTSHIVKSEAAFGNTSVRSIQNKNTKKQKKKKLNYNSREISSQLVRASKTGTASIVLVRAKTKVGVLKRCLGTGQYNDREVLAAVAHAQRMVNCAQLKVRNLKEEEQIKRKNEKEQEENRFKKKNEIKRKVGQKERELKNKIEMEKLQLSRKEKMQQQELCRKKRMNRSRELGKINEADMKYLKEKSENSEDSQQPDYNGVSLELSNLAMSLSELQMSGQAIKVTEQQLEQEIEMQIEMQMQAEGMSTIELSAIDTGTAAISDSTVSMESFDVSI